MRHPVYETPLSILLDLKLKDRDMHIKRPNHIEKYFKQSQCKRHHSPHILWPPYNDLTLLA